MIFIDKIATPLGSMFVGATDQGICLLEFTDRPTLERELKDLEKHLKTTIHTGQTQLTRQAKKEIEAYFQGTQKTFNVPIHAPGTLFQQAVWKALLSVPYGQTASYQQQAQKLGKPQAVRAVATANGANRISIMIPCHRIIGKDGSLTGYGGGLERKRYLLEHEQRYAHSPKTNLLI